MKKGTVRFARLEAMWYYIRALNFGGGHAKIDGEK